MNAFGNLGQDTLSDQKVSSKFGYYQVKPIAKQVEALRKYFPNLGSVNEEIVLQPLPEGAEGWFAVPKHERIARSYNEALQKAIQVSFFRRMFLGESIIQTERTAKMFAELINQQGNHDIIVVPVQFGVRYAGYSALLARNSFLENEFGLDSFTICCMLLTHPERLVSWNQLQIMCAGDESFHGSNETPLFCFRGEDVRFGSDKVCKPDERYGSPSGFLLLYKNM